VSGASRKDVERFLRELKRCERIFVVDERQDKKNEETLEILKITPKHREEEIRALRVKDYYRGPNPDHSNPSENVWEFGKKVRGEEIYIKVKIFKTSSGRKYGKCLSFHFPDKPITYPFKKREIEDV